MTSRDLIIISSGNELLPAQAIAGELEQTSANVNQNTIIFCLENSFGNIVCDTSTI